MCRNIDVRFDMGEMVYVTGDTHGEFARIKTFCEEFNTTKEDVMIILGDAGINYYGSGDKSRKKRLQKLPITLFCIHGNHEQRPEAIETYKLDNFHGGKVYVEEAFPDLKFAKDGEVYDFDGREYVVIGGAYSVDKFYRLARGVNWFDNEQPSDETKAVVESVLTDRQWNVYGVLSHTCPLKYEPVEVFLPMIDQSTVDKTTEEWLDKIEDKLTYEKWYCGHYHTEKEIDKLRFMFNDIDMLK